MNKINNYIPKQETIMFNHIYHNIEIKEVRTS